MQGQLLSKPGGLESFGQGLRRKVNTWATSFTRRKELGMNYYGTTSGEDNPHLYRTPLPLPLTQYQPH